MSYRTGDFLTVKEISDYTGKSVVYLHKLTGETNAHRDPNLFRLRVETDESYRKVFGTKARYVYPWPDVRDWYRERLQRPWVQGAAKRGQ